MAAQDELSDLAFPLGQHLGPEAGENLLDAVIRGRGLQLRSAEPGPITPQQRSDDRENQGDAGQLVVRKTAVAQRTVEG